MPKKTIDLSRLTCAKDNADQAYDDLIASCLRAFARHNIDTEVFSDRISSYDMKVGATHAYLLEMITEGADDYDLAAGLQDQAIWSFIELTCYGTDLFFKAHVDDSQQRKLVKKCEFAFAQLGMAVAELLPDLEPVDMDFIFQVRDKIRAGMPHGNEWKP